MVILIDTLRFRPQRIIINDMAYYNPRQLQKWARVFGVGQVD